MAASATRNIIIAVTLAVLLAVIAGLSLFRSAGKKMQVSMIGDSITAGGNWNALLPGVRLVNRGNAGDKTGDILARMQPILADEPGKAFLMAGINDLVQGAEPDAVLANLVAISERLKARKVRVHLQSTLECSKPVCGPWLEKVRELNRKLREHAAGSKLAYIDLNEALSTGNDGLMPQYTGDGFHLNDAGYAAWARLIAPYVQVK